MKISDTTLIDIESLSNIDRLIIFDIDQTLTNISEKTCIDNIEEMTFLFKSGNFETIRLADFLNLSKLNLNVFVILINTLNAKAIVNSSWFRKKQSKKNIEELKKAFFIVSNNDFFLKNDWLIGGTYKDIYCKNYKEKFKNLDFKGQLAIIDDTELNDKDNSFLIDGLFGLTINDLFNIFNHFKLTQICENDNQNKLQHLNYLYQKKIKI